MAFTNQQIIDYLLANPGLTDPQIVDAMKQFSITPAQMASAVGLSEGQIVSRIAATVPYGQTITLGDTIIQPVYQVTGSGESEQIGGLENVITYKATDNKAGGSYTQYTPTGVVEKTGTQQEVKSGLKEFALGAALLFGLPTLLNAGAATGAAATVGTTGLTTAELAQLDLALGGAGGTTGATSLTGALTTGANVGTLTNLTGGSGLLTGEAAGITAQSVADKLAADAAAQAQAKIAADAIAADAAAQAKIAADAKAVADAAVGADAATKAAADAAAAKAAADAAAAKTAADAAAAKVAADAAAAKTAADAAALAKVTATTLTTTELANAAKLGLTAAQYAQLFTSTAQTAGGLLQQQTSREAAQKAQATIEAETAAAKAAAQFRPIGMTTRFGSSQFGIDPLTGQLTSAGYTLSPEAKAAQDRFVKLAETGIQQAEGAQQAFAPLQTGAQSLFGLGNQYLAQNPQDVAQNYLNQQMALLQPGRELELANLQNRLQQQGRGGLSVAQGGALGATTPELQALFNARAQQEAQLAANAQQYGQQQVTFGAGLLSQGAQTMGQYYGGQQAAYAPYTTALGQVQGLETAAQQPFQLGVGLGKETSTAGYNVGRLGLTGAGQSVALATGADATRNPYATAIGGVTSNPLFTDALTKIAGGTPVNALDFGSYGTGDAGFQKMLDDIYG